MIHFKFGIRFYKDGPYVVSDFVCCLLSTNSTSGGILSTSTLCFDLATKRPIVKSNVKGKAVSQHCFNGIWKCIFLILHFILSLPQGNFSYDLHLHWANKISDQAHMNSFESSFHMNFMLSISSCKFMWSSMHVNFMLTIITCFLKTNMQVICLVMLHLYVSLVFIIKIYWLKFACDLHIKNILTYLHMIYILNLVTLISFWFTYYRKCLHYCHHIW